MVKFWERHSLASLGDGVEGDDKGRIFLVSDGGGVQQADLSAFTVVMESVDTVRQLYRGKPSRDWLDRLEQLKEGSSTPILNADVGGAAWGMLGSDHWLGQPWAVRSMGKASGFQWCLQNNDLGFTILFKSFYATEDREGAHLKIECSPKAISRRTPDELQAVLDAIAGELLSEAKPSGVAVHLAVDFQGWNLGGNFLDRLKTRSRVVRDFSGITKLEFHDIATAATTYGRGESFLVGKPLGCQLAAYLKSKEIIHSDKEDYFHDCWREASAGEFDPEQEVWRVEFRFHQEVLRDLGHNQGEEWESFSGLAYALGDIWRYGCGLHRLHVNDRLIDPYWQFLTQDCTFQNRVLGFFMCRKKKDGLGNSGKNVQLLVGNLVSLLARQGATADQVLKNLKALACWPEILRYYESIGRSESDIREAVKKGILIRRLTKQAA